jgi:4'-phosphopantetheinyl transferase EntD
VATEEVDPFVDELGELLPEEAEGAKNARAERLLEFRAGRHCARKALARLGLRGAPVIKAEDRSPVWPPGFVGSITHTREAGRGFCGAAVARAGAVRAVGVDAETDDVLEKKLWRRVLTRGEIEWISARPAEEQGFLGKLVFSAKESVYKCQYTLSHEFLEFAEVELAPPGDGTFTATLLVPAAPFEVGQALSGRWVRRDGYVVTAVTLG